MNENAHHLDDAIEEQDALFSLPVNGVAEFLSMRGSKPTVALLSPTGDDGSTACVMLARSMAELGRSVVLVDMTVSGCSTRLMAPEHDLAGLSNLLFGESAFGETIHQDRLSTAHIVPQGNALFHEATRITERLTMVLQALADSYDTVLLEFGAEEIEGVAALLKNVDAEVVLSLPEANEALVLRGMDELRAAGYPDVVIMSPQHTGS